MTEVDLTIRGDGDVTAVTVTDIRISPGGDGYAARVIDAVEREFEDDDGIDVVSG